MSRPAEDEEAGTSCIAAPATGSSGDSSAPAEEEETGGSCITLTSHSSWGVGLQFRVHNLEFRVYSLGFRLELKV